MPTSPSDMHSTRKVSAPSFPMGYQDQFGMPTGHMYNGPVSRPGSMPDSPLQSAGLSRPIYPIAGMAKLRGFEFHPFCCRF